MRNIVTPLLLAAAMLAAPATAARRDPPELKLQKLLAGRVAGQPVNCISLSDARSSEIIDGKAIVYRVGGRLYVNEPRSGAAQLDDDDVLVTRTSGSQLCSIDSVQLLDRSARIPHGFVVLGKFVPYTKAAPAR